MAKKKTDEKPEAVKIGRPSKWTPELKAEYQAKILHEIAANGMSLRKACDLDGFPSTRTVSDWLLEDTEFAQQYARACEERADKFADEIMAIADATAEDIIIDPFGNEVVNNNVIQRDKLRIDARKWLMSKMNPKKYGDSIKHTGDKDNPIVVEQITDMKID